MTYELRAYDLTTGAYITDLPDIETANLGFNFSALDAGMTMKYPGVGHGVASLATDLEVKLFCDDAAVDEGSWIVQGQSGDDVSEEGGALTVAGRHLTDVARKIIVRPTKPKQTELAYADKTLGFILNNLFAVASTRGTFGAAATGGWTRASFDAVNDSAGVAWVTLYDEKFKVGTTLHEILSNWIGRGLITVRLVGRDWRIFKGTGVGTVRDITLAAGEYLTESPYKKSTEERISHLVVQGDEGVWVERVAAGLPRREEGFATQSGTVKTATLNAVGDNLLASLGIQQEQRTVKTAAGWPIQPGKDFKTGDWINCDTRATAESLRVRTFTVEFDAEGVHHSIVMNDRILEADLKRAMKQSAALAGGGVTPGSLGLPTAPAPVDSTVPEPPTGLGPGVPASTAYPVAYGRTRSTATVTWVAPLLNTDGSDLLDLAGYRVLYRIDGALYWELAGDTELLTFTVQDLEPLQAYEFTVAAVDRSGHVSALPAALDIVTVTDTTPLATPPTPVPTTKLGTIRIPWNGLDFAGNPMAPNFHHASFYGSSVSGFVPSSNNRIGELQAAGAVIFSNPTPGTPYFFKTQFHSNTGAVSTSAESAAVTAAKISGVDLESGSIGFDALGYKDTGNLIPDGTFEIQAQRDQKNPSAGALFVNVGAAAFHGDWVLRFDAALSVAQKTMILWSGNKPVRPGDQLWTRAAWRRYNGSNGASNRIIGQFRNQDNTFNYQPLIGNLPATADAVWRDISLAFTVPALAESLVAIYAESYDTVGVTEFDAVEVRDIIGTSLIQDAAIARAKIQLLAVDDARIASLDGGKINAQSVRAEEVWSGVLGRNLVPNPSFEEDWGWQFNFVPAGGLSGYDSQIVNVNSGSRCLVILLAAAADGTSVQTPSAFRFAVKPNQEYRIIANAKGTSTTDGFYLRFQWYDAAGTFISEPSTNAETENQTVLADQYQEYASTYTSPANAATAGIILHYFQPDIAPSWLIIDDVAVIEVGVGASQLTSSGLKVWDKDGSLIIDLSSKLTGNLFNVQKNSQTVASINQDGGGSLTSLSVGNPADPDDLSVLTIGAKTYEELDWERPWGVIARGERTTSSGLSSVEAAYLEVQADLLVGRLYRIRPNNAFMENSSAGLRTQMLLKHTKAAAAGGAATQPTTASPILHFGRTVSPGASQAFNVNIERMLIVAGVLGEIYEHRFVLTHLPEGGGSSQVVSASTWPVQLVVEDVGPDKGDVGIDRSGSVVTKKDYTSTWYATWSQTYQGDNSKNTVSGDDAYQGYYSGTNGNQRSAIGFEGNADVGETTKTIIQALTGATVKKVEVYLYFYHWYNNSGGTAVIGTHGHSAEPSTWSGTDDLIRSGSWPKPGGRWVTLPSSTWAGFIAGTRRGVVLGPGPSTSHTYYGKAYGYSDSKKPQLRITYNR